MPPRRKRLDIDVMSSVVIHNVAKSVALKPTHKLQSSIKKPLAKQRTRARRLVKSDSSSSECNTPIYESPVLLAAITETPEKPIYMHVCAKCFDYIPHDNCVAYVTDDGLSYMHRTCTA
jgi:translation initiation factor 2B subunit (eIF-2B alpha/beta/delta family)